MKSYIKMAKAAMALRPSFKLLRVLGTPTRVKDKSFEVQCLDCLKVELRNLEWITSTYGCLCGKGKKIAEAHAITGDEFSTKWALSKRRLRLVSPYVSMHVRVDVECLRCHHVWDTAPTNLRHAGCPKCAPALAKKACLKKYGVEHHSQRPEVQQRIKQTFLKRYGVTSALQDSDFFTKMVKSSYKKKLYRLGKRQVFVQGYEPYALDYIIQVKGIKPSAIQCGQDDKIPSVDYRFRGQTHVYHPDIFIPSLNLIVEVKSTYTYKRSLEKNRAKRAACRKLGYRFKFLVFKKNGELHEDSDC